MKNIQLLLSGLVILLTGVFKNLQAQDIAIVNLSAVSASSKDAEWKGADQKLYLQLTKRTEEIILISSNNLQASVHYYVTAMRSHRSDLKNSGIRIRAVYKMMYNGMKQTKKIQRIFFAGDNRTSSEDFSFFFGSRMSPKTIHLKLLLTWPE